MMVFRYGRLVEMRIDAVEMGEDGKVVDFPLRIDFYSFLSSRSGLGFYYPISK